ncbi:MAG: AAA family ATPase [Sedimentibacter sp.]
MIPIKLTFQAFGPYVKKQEVDFQKFADSGVFLIHGITGSGKTTILDAMSYALYGKSSGGQRGDITAMRCQMAKEDIPTEVEFIFKISDKTYKFVRTINIRTKRNGSKEYNVSQNALFLNKEGIFVPFFENPKLKDIEQKSCELIGLNHEQFIQVIMLPQGKFEKLLMAKSDEKEEILVTLFNAEKWQEAAEWICDQAKIIARDISLKRENINVLLKSEHAENIEDLQNKKVDLNSQIEITSKEEQEKGNLLTAEKNKLELQTDIFNLFEEKVRTEKELLTIKKQEEHMNVLSTKLEKGRKALNVFQKYNIVMNMHKQLQEAKSKLETEEKNNLNCVSSKEKTEQSLENLKKDEEHIEKIKENKIKLEGLIEVYKGITAAKLEAEKENQKLNKLIDENKFKQELCKSSREKLKFISNEKEFIFKNYQMKLPELKDKKEKLFILDKKSSELKTINMDINKINKNLKMLNSQLDTNKSAAELKKKEYDTAYNHYIEETAYLISESLKDGQECPVCGSVHHPKMAVKSTNSAVDSSYVKNISLELDKLNKESNEIINFIAKQDAAKSSRVEKINNLQEEINELNKILSNNTKEEILAELKKAETEVNKLDDIINEESKLSKEISKLDKELSELSSAITEQSILKEEKNAKFNSLRSRKIDDIESEVDLQNKIISYKTEIDRYTTMINSLTEKMNTAEKLLSSSNASIKLLKENLESKNAEYENGKSEYYELLKENNFSDTTEFKQYLVSQDKLDEWDKQIQKYIIDKGSVAKNLDRLLKLTENKEKPDIEEIKDSISLLEKAITEFEKQIALNLDRKERIEKIIKKTEKEQKLLQEMIQKYDMYNSFGITLRGDRGISLRRYVLGVMLTSVTIEANRLLKNVHDGRYQLCRTLEGSGRSRKAGLELEVFDAYSGEKRGVAGLSGGEKFLVSLALSLGLSAVVQAQTGGIRIDTMFIDEGFGSLDSSSIRDALNILSSVKGSKRLVGIISHVQMLKETIEASISVVKDRSGSMLSINS